MKTTVISNMTNIKNLVPRLFINIYSVLPKRKVNFNTPLIFKNICCAKRNYCSDYRRFISTSCILSGSAARAETTSTTQGLSKLQAEELVLRLTSEERTILINALHEYQSKLVKDEYEGKSRCVLFV